MPSTLLFHPSCGCPSPPGAHPCVHHGRALQLARLEVGHEAVADHPWAAGGQVVVGTRWVCKCTESYYTPCDLQFPAHDTLQVVPQAASEGWSPALLSSAHPQGTHLISTKWHSLTPRDSASMPTAPVPANKSSHLRGQQREGSPFVGMPAAVTTTKQQARRQTEAVATR